VTEPFNFRTEKAYLSLWVDFLKQGFYVDDIRVDVLPPTDVASASGGSADAPNPQDMFGELEKKEVPGEFDMLDSDKNRRIDRKEIESPFGKRWVDSQNKLLRKKWSFESKDKDRNGYIDLDEWKK
ncbi:hypothetical protein HY256_05480, partial [Candidatus Sumerlaeota bacterium]|nr:hypothetical protein [Candidatus Sumerlaeota bacterium]